MLFIIIYLIIGLVLSCVIIKRIYEKSGCKDYNDYKTKAEIVPFWFIFIMLGLFWPIILILVAIYWLWGKFINWLCKPKGDEENG